ncbi:hypothetical protein [Paractinoplanes rishiriensis]|uniref:Uncharacterized protein n=1 Tax=Paractinoplanes rishiriensis TaxID=1050105 RepID=A0A919MYJ8_9ACTN|nr:hypothetical protein [Actinoplanes rishiriensis]GIE99999.1 hypothetical protein Ari01nite_74640 [Actinoplanes rishiriensis]
MAPETDQASAESTLQAATDKLRTEIDRIDPEYRKFVEKINSVMMQASFISPVGAWLFSKKVKGALDDLHGKLEDAADEMIKYLEQAAPVFALIGRGFTYLNAVLPDLSGMTGTARDIRPNALHTWGGDAGRAYSEKRQGQSKAIEGTGGIVKDTGQWLVDVAALNAKFLVDITQPLIDLVEAIIEGAIELSTVIGVLEAIDTIAAAIADCLGAVLEILKEATKHMVDSITSLAAARAILNDNSVYPAGNWPQAVNR